MKVTVAPRQLSARILFLLLTVLSLTLGGAFTRAAAAAGQTFYVDSASGSDQNDGLAPSTAWRTMARVKNAAPGAGDTVLLKRGSFWREQLTVARSGVEGAFVTYGAYGEGDGPVLCGADIVAGWTDAGGDLWASSLADEPKQVFIDGMRGVSVATLADLDAVGEWFWADGVLTLVSNMDPDAYSNPGVEASIRCGVFAWEKADVIIRDIAVVRATYGLYLGQCARVTVDGVRAETNHYDGLMADGANTSTVTFRNCISKANGRHGLLANDASDVVVDGGEFSGNATNYSAGVGMNGTTGGKITGVSAHGNFYGLKVSDASGTLVEKSEAFDNTDFGIDLDIGSSDINVVGNKVHGNGSHGIVAEWDASRCSILRNRVWDNGETHGGIFVEKATDIQIVGNIVTDEYVALWINGGAARVKAHNNTISRASSIGVLLRDAVSAVELKNNIATDCSYKTVYVNPGCTEGFVADRNDWFADGGRFKWDGTTYDFAGWQQASGQDANTMNADPMFVNADEGDFNLQGGSPCIDAGADLGVETDFDGTAVPQGDAPDIGAQERAVQVVEPPANMPPQADAGPDQQVSAGDMVILDGAGSTDADGEVVAWEWDLDADGVYDVADCATDCTFWSAGTYILTLRVTDDDGAAATDSCVVDVVETAPEPQIPAMHVAGVEIAASRRRRRLTADGYVTVVDAEGLPVQGATVALTWSLDGSHTADTAVTNGGGVASSTLRTRVNRGDLLSLTVTDVTLDGVAYDAEANTTDSAQTVIK